MFVLFSSLPVPRGTIWPNSFQNVLLLLC